MKAGWMEPPEVELLEYGLRALVPQVPMICEIGLGDGRTLAGIKALLPQCVYFAIDNGQHDAARAVWDSVPAVVFRGDSAVMHRYAPPLDFLIIDGCHCENHAMLDFLNYGTKVNHDGFVFFHDANTGGGVERSQGFKCPLAEHDRAGVFSAMVKLGLINGERQGWQLVKYEMGGLGAALFRRVA